MSGIFFEWLCLPFNREEVRELETGSELVSRFMESFLSGKEE